MLNGFLRSPALRIEGADEFLGNVVRMQFAIDMSFTHTARDELGVLRTEIEDEDFFMGHGFM